jgi:hypothetical protein
METIKTISLIRNQKVSETESKNEALLSFKIKNDVSFENITDICNKFNESLDNNNPDDYVYLIPNERLVLNIDLNSMNQEAKDKLVQDLENTFTTNKLGVVSNENNK